MDLETLKLWVSSLSQKGVYPIMKDSTRIVVIKVILQSEICLWGKIATLLFGTSVEIAPQWKLKTEKNCLCHQEEETACHFNLQGIFVPSQAIILSELTHNFMISISICFCNQTWLEPLPCQRWSSLRPQLTSISCQVLLQSAPSYTLQGSWIRVWENNPTVSVVWPNTFLK